MASGAKDSKEEVKKNIRALLESAPHGIYLSEVGSEYRMVVGTTLPYRKLGYSTVQELFTDIPDTAVITPSNRGLLITCVANAKTEHIERMVRSQKSNSKSKHCHAPKTAPVHLLQECQRKAGHVEKRPLLEPSPNRGLCQQPPLVKQQPPPTKQHLQPMKQHFQPMKQHPPLMQQHVPMMQQQTDNFGYNPMRYAHPAMIQSWFQNQMLNARMPFMGHPLAVLPGLPYPPYNPHGGRQPHFQPPAQRCIPNPIQNLIKAVLEKYPSGLTEKRFVELLYSEFQYELFPDLFGCNSIFEVLGSLPAIVTLRNTGMLVLIFPAKSQHLLSHNGTPETAHCAQEPASAVSCETLTKVPANNQNAGWIASGLAEHVASREALTKATGMLPKSACPVVDSGHRSVPENVDSSGSRKESVVNRPPISDASRPTEVQNSSSAKRTQDLRSLAKLYKTTSVQTVMHQPNELNVDSVGNDRLVGKPESPSCCTNNKWAVLKPRELTNVEDGSRNDVKDSMKAVFRQVLGANPNGIWASELIKLYKEHSGHRLDFRELGFYSIHELVVSVQDVFNVKRSKKMGDWLLMPSESSTIDSGMDSSSQQSVEMAKNEERDKARISISQALKKKMMQVICSCPSGAVLSDFEILYKRMHSEDFVLNYSDNYYTAEAVFLALPDLFVVDYVSDAKIVIQATSEGRRFLCNKIEIAEPPRPKSESYPDDVIITTPKLQTQPLPADMTEKSYVELFVTYIIHPGQFWIRLRETSAKVDTLMTQLKMVYHNPSLSRKYIMPDHLITQNRVCAALFPDDENWYRAIIVSIQADDMVQVFYVDFGNLGSVHRSKIRLLKKQFLTLPFQALMAKLTRVVPVKKESWSDSAIRRFIQLCLDKPLVALVSSYEASLLSLCLCDTTAEDDIHINTTLVAEGYAAFECITKQPFKVMSEIKDNRNNSSCQNRAQLACAANYQVTPARPSMTDRSPQGMPLSRSMIESASDIQLDENNLNIIPTSLMNSKFHIIRLDGIMYVPTSEISSLFWKGDVLTEMVRLLAVSVSFLTVQKFARPIIFEKLLHLCTKENMIVMEIVLCPLDRVPDILSAVASDRKELHNAFLDLVKLHKVVK